MKLIVDFYKSLDTINLILFWGIIIVITLLLIFSIILVNKNKKLKRMIIRNNQQATETTSDIPIQVNIQNNYSKEVEENNNIKEEKTFFETKQETPIIIEEKPPKEETHLEEEKFIAEEHVMEYNQKEFPQIEKEPTNIPSNNLQVEIKNEEKVTTGPYQKNVLRDLPSQTSPIGIVRPNNEQHKELEKAQELKELLTEETKTETVVNNNIEINNVHKEVINKEKKDYLEEVKDNLSKAVQKDDISRTEYELQQEEDAIISYEELMQKKDQIKMVDEEEAVISIEELIDKKREKERLYQLTEEEENDKFIKELKNFRNDL